jgi:23S rRNA (guanosine2251-2'-O)-methyltransferase
MSNTAQSIIGVPDILQALKSQRPITQIVIPKDLERNNDVQKLIQEAKKYRIKTSIEPEGHQVEAMLSGSNILGLSDLIETLSETTKILALDHLEDPHNVGAIIRSCVFFGISHILMSKNRQCQITPGVVKSSAYTVDQINIVRVSNVGDALLSLKKEGVWVYSTDVNGGTPLDKMTLPSPGVVILGNEHKGTSPRLLKLADEALYIPNHSKVNSLNVSVAAGIIAYHWSKG